MFSCSFSYQDTASRVDMMPKRQYVDCTALPSLCIRSPDMRIPMYTRYGGRVPCADIDRHRHLVVRCRSDPKGCRRIPVRHLFKSSVFNTGAETGTRGLRYIRKLTSSYMQIMKMAWSISQTNRSALHTGVTLQCTYLEQQIYDE
jgi:hypothetical protein